MTLLIFTEQQDNNPPNEVNFLLKETVLFVLNHGSVSPKWSMTNILPIYNPQANYEILYLSLPDNPFLALMRQSPLKRLRTPPEKPQTRLALMFTDVSRIIDVKRIFYRFITVFIAVSQPHSD